MDANYEAFILYYTAFHEFEISVKEFKDMLISDIGEDGFAQAIAIFKQDREKRESVGDKRTMYEATHEIKGNA
jgi:hypothetical protein